MIKLIKNSELKKTITYQFYGIRCNCCNSTNNVNVLEIRAENSSGGTIIDICDKCLKQFLIFKNIKYFKLDILFNL